MSDKLKTGLALLADAVRHPRAAFFALRERGLFHIARRFLRADSATGCDMARDVRFRSAPATLESLRAYYGDLRFDAADDSRHHLVHLPSGERFLVRKARGWQDVGVLHEVFVDGRYAAHPPLQGATVLDIGANIGDTVVFFGKSGADVIAYEPDPEMCELARRNAALNGVSADIRNAGIGATSQTMRLSASAEGADAMSATLFPGTRPVNRLHVSTVPIQVVAFGDIVAEFGSLRLVKFDCDGCEYPALLSLPDDSLACVEHIMMEYHGPSERLAEKLQRCGFSVRREGNMHLYADRAGESARADLKVQET